MRISVALCTYNGAGFIEEQLRSILAQSRPVDEVVVSDDGSEDGTVGIVERTLREHPDVATSVLLRTRGQAGVTANFERAIAACSGELIALSDQDDIWRSDRIEIAAAEFESRPDLLLLHGNARMVDGDGTPLGYDLFRSLDMTARERALISEGLAFDALMHRNLVTGATTMIRAGLAALAAPFPPEWLHDEWLAVIGAASGRIDLIDSPLIDYRQHAANQVGSRRLSVTGKFGRILIPRGDKNVRLAGRARVLLDRLRTMDGIDSRALRLADGKVRHEAARAALPSRRVRRVVPVARRALAGGYRAFGRGAGDVVRDLVQPA